ncbi:hypothetical protein A4A49_52884 [Nicotiana attenuata]|uniref:Uncharacterized protein n=1 Tax=Nicotiana attenuata TaxID=49451 RepID=A0A1J6J254_NICAT|nr:hypothetical protein A4A49_52884 [Nicotiana attenuata]
MSGSCRHFLIFVLLFCIVVSEGSRLPAKASTWEQMLPKKLPSPSSAPSKGTNSVTTSSTTMKINRKLMEKSNIGAENLSKVA